MGIRFEGAHCKCGANHFTTRSCGDYFCSKCDRPMSEVGERPERSRPQLLPLFSFGLMAFVFALACITREPIMLGLFGLSSVFGLIGVIFHCLQADPAAGDAINASALRDILSAPNPLDRVATPPAAEPEGKTSAGLPLPLNDADYQIANAIDYACWDAGLCNLCGKQQYSEQPELECGCIGGTRAHNRLVWHTERLIEKRIAEGKTEPDPLIVMLQDQITYRLINGIPYPLDNLFPDAEQQSAAMHQALTDSQRRLVRQAHLMDRHRYLNRKHLT